MPDRAAVVSSSTRPTRCWSQSGAKCETLQPGFDKLAPRHETIENSRKVNELNKKMLRYFRTKWCIFMQYMASIIIHYMYIPTIKLTGTVCLAFCRRLRIFFSRLIQFITTEPLASSASSVTVMPSAIKSGTAHAYAAMLSIRMLKKVEMGLSG